MDRNGATMHITTLERAALVRRGLQLNHLTRISSVAEAIARVLVGSVALVGFGLDSVIEVTASVAAQWRLRADVDPIRRAPDGGNHRIDNPRPQRLRTHGAKTLLQQDRPDRSVVGIVLLAMSAVVMPLLVRVLLSDGRPNDVLAIVIAAAAGLVVRLLVMLIGLITNIAFFHRVSTAFSSPSDAHVGAWVLVIPVVGALVVGVMARYGSAAIRGHGIPEVMKKVLRGESRIPRASS